MIKRIIIGMMTIFLMGCGYIEKDTACQINRHQGVTRESVYVDGNNLSQIYTYSYDDEGRVASIECCNYNSEGVASHFMSSYYTYYPSNLDAQSGYDLSGLSDIGYTIYTEYENEGGERDFYAYDIADNLIYQVTDYGDEHFESHIKYMKLWDGSVKAIHEEDGLIETKSYNKYGDVTSCTMRDENGILYEIQYDYKYDDNGEIITCNMTTGKYGSTNIYTVYEYDVYGRLIKEIETSVLNDGNGECEIHTYRTVEYTYNDDQLVLQVTRTVDEENRDENIQRIVYEYGRDS